MWTKVEVMEMEIAVTFQTCFEIRIDSASQWVGCCVRVHVFTCTRAYLCVCLPAHLRTCACALCAQCVLTYLRTSARACTGEEGGREQLRGRLEFRLTSGFLLRATRSMVERWSCHLLRGEGALPTTPVHKIKALCFSLKYPRSIYSSTSWMFVQ